MSGGGAGGRDRAVATAARLAAVAVLMGSLAWASVPLYDWFCRVTGFGGATDVAAAAPDVPLDETIAIRFDASLARGMPWEFRPVEREMELRIGETGLAFYEAYNPTDRTVAGSASYNVTPFEAGGHFSKIDCFCFEEQVLGPGERVEMPVSFFVDPGIVDDLDARHVHTITLSYTFHEIDLPETEEPEKAEEESAALSARTGGVPGATAESEGTGVAGPDG